MLMDFSGPSGIEYDTTSRFCMAFVLICLLLVICYSNSFFCTWQFDDFGNIIGNAAIKLKDFSLPSLKKAIYADPQTGSISRPLAFLSFAINWYFGKDHVFGYHLVNLFIHCVSSFFLLLAIYGLLLSPLLYDRYRPGERYFISFLAAVLWAVNPIQTQAVTYIVQRMAELAGMFYIIGLYAYIRGRLSKNKGTGILFFLICLLCFLLATASKPNAAVMPISVLLVELIFFNDMSDPLMRRKALLYTTVCGILVASAGFFYFYSNNVNHLLDGYRNRPFSLQNRLLTEPRVIFFYLSEIFYPVPTRLSLEHVYPLSVSLWSPPTTFLCLFALFLLIIATYSMLRRLPVLSFAVLFFLINHLIESSVIPLEIIFEHRNYLPSMFLFFPVSLGILSGMKYYHVQNRMVYRFLVSALTLLVFCLGFGTYVRNMAWRTQKTLWEDALAKAPESPRPYHNLAWGYYEKKGDYAEAIKLYEKAASLGYVCKTNRAQPYYGIGCIYDKLGNYEKAISNYKKAIDITYTYQKPHYKLAVDLIRLKKFGEAEKHADFLLSIVPGDASYLWLKGLVCLDMKRWNKALFFFRKALWLDHSNWKFYFYTGTAMNHLKEYDRAFWFFRRADELVPGNPVVQLSLALCRYSGGHEKDAAGYAARFIDAVGMSSVSEFLKSSPVRFYHIPFGFERIYPMIKDEMKRKINGLKAIVSDLK